MSVAKKALQRLDSGKPLRGGKGEDDTSPFREAAIEAYEAARAENADAFARAFEAAIDIRMAERD